MPALFTQGQNVEAGADELRVDLGESYRRGAYYVDRLLKGAKAAEFPIERPRRSSSASTRRPQPHSASLFPQSTAQAADRILSV